MQVWGTPLMHCSTDWKQAPSPHIVMPRLSIYPSQLLSIPSQVSGVGAPVGGALHTALPTREQTIVPADAQAPRPIVQFCPTLNPSSTTRSQLLSMPSQISVARGLMAGSASLQSGPGPTVQNPSPSASTASGS